MKRVLLIAGNETRLILVDPFPILLLILMPLVLASFLSSGLIGGAAQAIPGLAALFGFFSLSVTGFAFYREHGWNTWDRLRASPASPLEVVAGKSLPLVVMFLVQQAFLLTFGSLVFDMPWRGSVLAGAVMIVVIVLTELSLGLLVMAACQTLTQLNAVAYLGAMTLAGLGGAMAPVWTLPAWVRHIAPASPVYWALQGLRRIAIDGGSFGEIGRPLLVLSAVTVAATTVSLRRYRHDERKKYFAM